MRINNATLIIDKSYKPVIGTPPHLISPVVSVWESEKNNNNDDDQVAIGLNRVTASKSWWDVHKPSYTAR